VTASQDQPSADDEAPVDTPTDGGAPIEEASVPTGDEPPGADPPTDEPTAPGSEPAGDSDPTAAEPAAAAAEPAEVPEDQPSVKVPEDLSEAAPEDQPSEKVPEDLSEAAPEDRSEAGPEYQPFEEAGEAGPEDEPSEEAAEDQVPGPDDEAPESRRSLFVGLSLLAVVLVGILIAVLVTGGGSSPSGGSSAPTTQAPPTGPTLPPAAFTSFHDDVTGFTMIYPTGWQRAQAPVSEMRLVVSDGQGEAVSVRVNNTEQVTTPENLGNIRAVTDGTIASNPTAQVLKTDVLSVNGLIGYYYLYTFKDTASGFEGVHAHYFLFKDHRMFTIVFQVLPSDRLSKFTGVFEQMAQSFKVDPEPPTTPAPTSTTP
jgi:hypothetical protein